RWRRWPRSTLPRRPVHAAASRVRALYVWRLDGRKRVGVQRFRSELAGGVRLSRLRAEVDAVPIRRADAAGDPEHVAAGIVSTEVAAAIVRRAGEGLGAVR